MEEVLQEAQFGVAADERGLEAVLATAATALGDDPDRAPCRHRRGLALEILLVDWFERDRDTRRALRRFTDEHRSRRGDGL